MTMPKRRTANFRDDETRLLIQLWGSPAIQNQMNTSHRKAPIMLQLAALMQQYGFSRTPEEITTRIRNLKCIYHRIKKSLRTGVGLVDPDWHHFKAIDAILGENSPQNRVFNKPAVFPAPFIKTEKESVDEITNSMYSNDSHSSLYDDDREVTGSYVSSPPMQGLTITSSTSGAVDLMSVLRSNHIASKAKYAQDGGDSFGVRGTEASRRQYFACPSRVGVADTSRANNSSEESNFRSPEPKRRCTPQNNNEVSGLLQQLLDVEHEHLQLEKQRLEFDRMIGTQLLALVPMVGSILQNHFLSQQRQHQQQRQQQEEPCGSPPPPSPSSATPEDTFARPTDPAPAPACAPLSDRDAFPVSSSLLPEGSDHKAVPSPPAAGPTTSDESDAEESLSSEYSYARSPPASDPSFKTYLNTSTAYNDHDCKAEKV